MSEPRSEPSREDHERGLPGFHDPTAGFGGAPPAQSALTLRLVLAGFGLVDRPSSRAARTAAHPADLPRHRYLYVRFRAGNARIGTYAWTADRCGVRRQTDIQRSSSSAGIGRAMW